MWIKASRRWESVRVHRVWPGGRTKKGNFLKERDACRESTEGRVRRNNNPSWVEDRQLSELGTRVSHYEKVKERGLRKKIQSIFLYAGLVRETPEDLSERRKVERDTAKPKRAVTELNWGESAWLVLPVIVMKPVALGAPPRNRGRKEEEDRLRSTFSERLYPRL